MSHKLLYANPTHQLSTTRLPRAGRLLRAALAALALSVSTAAAHTPPPASPQTPRDSQPPAAGAQQTPVPSSTTQRESPQPTPEAQSTDGVAESRTQADEEFELNISERRVTRERLEASTAVEVGDERTRGLDLRVGVALGASRIDALLRNVRGRVRFRASLAPVLERLNQRPPPRPAPAPAPPPARPSP
ncbi:MAG TPA: hypothetical protein VGV38_21705 [Pyrinomonadaceae bacterium]|nr:hypothetical protein [Pyrinomonadaceae bacterium]